MKKVADFYFVLSDQQLLDLFRAGDTDAVSALIGRHDGIPPVGDMPTGVLTVVVWTELLTGQRRLDHGGMTAVAEPRELVNSMVD